MAPPTSEDLFDEAPPSIDPYECLGLRKEATDDEIKKAYRKAALKNHPDKVEENQKAHAHVKFQAIAFAYAVLSDSNRRKRYDTTGSTSESIFSSNGFNWSDFYREQFAETITAEAIDKIAKVYKGSDEERDEILAAYTKYKGNMDKIYQCIMLSDVEADDERFRTIIDDAIERGDVKSYKAYANETQASKDKRKRTARDEEAEAIQHAKDLGIHDQVFGGGKSKGKKKAGNGEDDLKAMILKNQQKRGGFLDMLEEKYAKSKVGQKKGRKRTPANDEEGEEEEEEEEDGEPSEEAFQAAAAQLNQKSKMAGSAECESATKKSKRTKR